MDPASFQHSINVFIEVSRLSFREVVNEAIEQFGSRSKRSFVIYAGTMWRELCDFFIFENIGELSLFNRNRSRSSSGCGYGFRKNVVWHEIRIEVNRSGEGFLVASDIGNHKEKEFVTF